MSLIQKAIQEPLIQVKDLSHWIGWKPKTIYDWAETERIPHYKLGSRLMFSPTEIRAWLNSLHKGPKVGQNSVRETASENEEVDL